MHLPHLVSHFGGLDPGPLFTMSSTPSLFASVYRPLADVEASMKILLYDPYPVLNGVPPSRASHEKTMKMTYQSLHKPSMPAAFSLCRAIKKSTSLRKMTRHSLFLRNVLSFSSFVFDFVLFWYSVGCFYEFFPLSVGGWGVKSLVETEGLMWQK